MEALKLSDASPVLDYQEETIDLNRILHANPNTSFVTRVKGDGMIDANMPDGCMVVVDRSIRPATGDIIVAALDGEYTVKRLVKAGRNWVLHPENSFYKPILITDDMDFQVWGVVTAVIVDLRK
ncbi:LexA family protein [Chitinophaga vietnamensis]|uniref:LexA family protein n=1 Tax=Chitinophaga vietnamensis TaxID=2593957 RepID=UPI001F006BE0|nr:translesion error-prone DNA polymerase V autoproteolytic subunit [Chitinophaga vietnamensis]